MKDLFQSRRSLHCFYAMLLLGFSSGLPLFLISSTLQAWFTEAGISVIHIGYLGLLWIPAAFKFLWAPLLDYYNPPFLGRRRGWMFIFQVALVISVALLAVFDPSKQAPLIAIIALLVAFFSASQDIAIDAYRTDILSVRERGIGVAIFIAGYRAAMIISGGIALILASIFGWHVMYLMMSGLFIIGVLGALTSPKLRYTEPTTLTFMETIIEPFSEFLKREKAVQLLLFILLYKFSYESIFMLTPTFLLRHLGFSLIEVGSINKIVAPCALMAGLFVGGAVLTKLGTYKSLLLFGALQALGCLSYMLLAIVGKNYLLFVVVVSMENFFAGMETAAFVAFLMSLCNYRYTATQYALLSALMIVVRIIAGPISGYIQTYFGWTYFYLWTFLIAIPSLLLLWSLRNSTGVFVHVK